MLKWNRAVNSRGAIMVIIMVQDGECVSLSSIIHLIRIDKLTAVFSLIFYKHFVFFRQDCNRLLEVIEAWGIAHLPRWMSLLKMTSDQGGTRNSGHDPR